MRHLQGFINYTIHGNVGSYLDVIRAATRIQISVPHSCVQPAAAMANQQAGPALPAFVYRISTADEWAELQRAGATLGGDLDRSTGCIHLSDISQVSPNPNTAWFPPAYALPNFTKFVKSYYPAWTDLGCYFFFLMRCSVESGIGHPVLKSMTWSKSMLSGDAVRWLHT